MINNVERFEVIEGDLYPIMGEDTELHVFNCEIVAILKDGSRWGNGIIVPGHRFDLEGNAHPNYSYKAECDGIIELLTRGQMSVTSDWYKISEPPSLEQRLEQESFAEAFERAGFVPF